MAEKRKFLFPFKKRNKKLVESDRRITNDTISDFRQGVIEKGKKFKYPIQYEQHKVVINASVVALLTLVILIALTWWGLYKTNSNNLVLFKLTQLLPLSVGEIDSSPISYGDYFAQYRSSLHYYQTKEGLPEDKDSLEELKKQFRNQAFQNAATIAFAKKLAPKTDVSVSKEDIEQDIDSKLSHGGNKLSREAYDEIMMDNYGLNRTEYENLFVKNPLLVRRVSFAVDDEASRLSDEITAKIISDGSNFQAIADEYSTGSNTGRITVSDSGAVKHTNSDGGQTKAALALSLNHVAGPIISTDASGYYFVKLVSKDDLTLRYQSILVPLREFNKRLEAIKRDKNGYKSYANIDISFD